MMELMAGPRCYTLGSFAGQTVSVLEMGKYPKFWARVRFRFSDDKGSVLFGFELERCFRGGRLLRIKRNCDQLIN